MERFPLFCRLQPSFRCARAFRESAAHAFSALGFWKKFFPKYTGRVSIKRTPAFRLQNRAVFHRIFAFWTSLFVVQKTNCFIEQAQIRRLYAPTSPPAGTPRACRLYQAFSTTLILRAVIVEDRIVQSAFLPESSQRKSLSFSALPECQFYIGLP